MARIFGLVGGGEFSPGCENMDRDILKASGQDPARIIVIPTAALTDPTRAASHGVQYFSRLGGDASSLMVLDRIQANDARSIQIIEKAGVIYFTGGNPEHLLNTITNTRLLDAIASAIDNRAVLVGSSAGAMVLGSLMRKPSSGRWVDGLGIVPGYAVLPHHEESDPAEISHFLQTQTPFKLTTLGIDSKTGCLGTPDSWRVIGSGQVTVYRGSGRTVYSSGDRIPADV
jgi:cyanophycinase